MIIISVYVTGDTHADFMRFSKRLGWFPEQELLTKDDIVIILGDFGGVWEDTPGERWWLDWLNRKSFTTVFVDGNHENFDRYYGNEFPIVDFCGGAAHQIRDSIYHLMRGYVFNIEGKTFFAFGGAQSHDIDDGILNPADSDFHDKYKEYLRQGKTMFRLNHRSWWKQELPSKEEMQRGRKNLSMHDYKVDYVITHCLPQSVLTSLAGGHYYEPDILTTYFDSLLDEGLQFKSWMCGHYHQHLNFMGKYDILYEQIVRIL